MKTVSPGLPVGMIQSSAIHNLASPADIQDARQAMKMTRQENQMSNVPGKCNKIPTHKSGKVTWLGTLLVRRSYTLTAVTRINKAIQVMP